MADTSDDASKLGVSNLVAVAAGATTLITTLSALAVTGALQQMQRNHGVLLIAAFACVLIAAAIWVALALSKQTTAPAPPAKGIFKAPADRTTLVGSFVEQILAPALDDAERKRRALTDTIVDAGRSQRELEAAAVAARATQIALIQTLGEIGKRRFLALRIRVANLGRRIYLGGAIKRFIWRRGFAEFLSLGFFIAGITIGVIGMIITQQAQERPTVTASLDPKTLLLTVTATAHNLGTEDHMRAEVDGLTPTQNPDGTYSFKEDARYVTLTGPDAGGTATQQFTYAIPATARYTAVGISASTSAQSSCDWVTTLAEKPGPQQQKAVKEIAPRPPEHTLPGCTLIYLPTPQQLQARPSVTAAFDPKTRLLSVTATAHDVRADGSMTTEVDGLTPRGTINGVFGPKPDVRYVTRSGPDAGGAATQTFTVAIPTKYAAVGVSAIVGAGSRCNWERLAAKPTSTSPAPLPGTIPPGCALVYLPSA